MAKAGDIESALRTARGIETEYMAYLRDRALSGIAEAQAKAGDIHGALRTARSIEGGLDRATTLSSITQEMLAADQH